MCLVRALERERVRVRSGKAIDLVTDTSIGMGSSREASKEMVWE